MPDKRDTWDAFLNGENVPRRFQTIHRIVWTTKFLDPRRFPTADQTCPQNSRLPTFSAPKNRGPQTPQRAARVRQAAAHGTRATQGVHDADIAAPPGSYSDARVMPPPPGREPERAAAERENGAEQSAHVGRRPPPRRGVFKGGRPARPAHRDVAARTQRTHCTLYGQTGAAAARQVSARARTGRRTCSSPPSQTEQPASPVSCPVARV